MQITWQFKSHQHVLLKQVIWLIKYVIWLKIHMNDFLSIVTLWVMSMTNFPPNLIYPMVLNLFFTIFVVIEFCF